MSAPSMVQIIFQNDPPVEIEYRSDEPVWSFSQRLGQKTPYGLSDDKKTMFYKVICNGVAINTYATRLMLMGTVFPDPNQKLFACRHDLDLGEMMIYSGNASAQGSDRETCSICIEKVELVKKGRTDNPLIPVILRCHHVFHLGCVKPAIVHKEECPLCRDPIDSNKAAGIKRVHVVE